MGDNVKSTLNLWTMCLLFDTYYKMQNIYNLFSNKKIDYGKAKNNVDIL